MKLRLPAAVVIICFQFGIFASLGQSLSIHSTGNKSAQITWPNSVPGLILEAASVLGPSAGWRPVAEPPLLANGQYSITLDASGGARFFRLHTPALASITASSPVNGETGVAVLRETIVHFSSPLSPSAVVTTNNFYAGYGGRRLLSRVELSSDRTKATLFYLEPMPGSTRVVAVFDGAGLTDFTGRPVDPDGDGQAGGAAIIAFDTLNLTALSGTAVIGTVYASELVPGSDTGTNAVNKPLSGVTITVDGREQDLRAVTDAKGNFNLSPAPPGRFFVHIDGRTAVDAAAGIQYPDKSYYPYVGKAWDAVAGRTNNLAGGTGTIYLPLITVGTLQPVSMTADTPISFPPSVTASNPALAGVSITVPASSLFSDDGTRGGRVGIAPVPPDRLPGPLPPGLELPIVITVQTDGPLNFDKPAPVCFPNLPDPVLGVPLPANSKQALISFNHKKGIWEAVGSMTVSADGRLICTDPGVGILQPGWQGVGPAPVEPPPPEVKIHVCDLDQTFDNCIHECEVANKKCKDAALETALSRQDLCTSLVNNGLLSDGDKCYKDAYLASIQQRTRCATDNSNCVDDCDLCTGGPAPGAQAGAQGLNLNLQRASRAAQLPAASDPVVDQLVGIIDQINELIRPFATTRSPIPPNSLIQISALRQQADLVASGDAAQFVRSRLIAQEESIAALARSRGREPEDLNPGNAPSYPVLYAALISRPQGSFVLRGETGPLGQYSLFVPRDGILLDVSFYDPKTKGFALITPNLSPNARFRLPRFTLALLASDVLDFDRDGLPDLVEDVYGTDPTKADTDGDGIPDGAEVEQGTNPLDGLAAQTGIIATTKTPGPAVDVWAGNDLVVTAEGTAGVSVLNAYNGANPIILAHLSTPGNAQRVAGDGNFIAVAGGDAGLSIVDVAGPGGPLVRHQVSLGGASRAVAVAGNMAFVSVDDAVVAVELELGRVLDRHRYAGGTIHDLSVAGDFLYILSVAGFGPAFPHTVHQVRVAEVLADPVKSLQISGHSSFGQMHLFAGGELIYVGAADDDATDQVPGIEILRDTGSELVLVGPPSRITAFDVAVNGSGLALFTGADASRTAHAKAGLLDVSDATRTDQFLTAFTTPGGAQAIALFNGLAYVADGAAGLQVINYLAADTKGIAPAISLSANFPFSPAQAEEHSRVRLTALASDDVQVRNVEFYLDGTKAFSDGSFPFDYQFVTPALTLTKTNFTLRARAFDTGGNSTWSDQLIVALLPDKTPPRVTETAPLGGARTLSHLDAYFSEPMNPATLNAASFQLVSAGVDGLPGTADDVPVSGGVVSYRADIMAASLDFVSLLPNGLYRAVVTSAVTDRAGNRLAADYTWQFRVADAVFWSKNIDGVWDDPFNWSTGAVPGPSDNVIIDVFPADITVILGSGPHVIKSLIANERLEIIDSILQVSGALQIGKDLTLRNGTLKGGIVTQIGGAKLGFTSHPGNTFDGVSVKGDLDLTSPGARLLIRNGLTLTGTVMLDNSSALGFAGDQTFDTGSVLFAGGSGFLSVEGSTTLTLGPAIVVRGKTGSIGQGVFFGGPGKLINEGLISADVAGATLSITGGQFDNAGTIEGKNGGSLSLMPANWSNTGRIDVTGGGALTFDGTWTNTGTMSATDTTVNLGGTYTLGNLGTFKRTGGTVNLTGVLDLGGAMLTLDAATGSWTLNGGTIKGGSVTESGAIKLIFTSNTGNTLDGVSVKGDLDLTSPGARLLIRNGLTLIGTVLLDNSSALGFAGDQTFDTGSVVFAGGSGFLSVEGNTTLTLGPAILVRGKTGSIGRGVFFGGPGKLINEGLISADVAGATLSITGGQFDNAGTIEGKNGGSLNLMPANWSNTGRIDVTGGGALTFDGTWNNSGTITATDVTVNLGGTYTLGNLGTFKRTGGTVNLTGLLDLNGGLLTLDAGTGSWTLNGGTIKGGSVTESGAIKLILTSNPGNTLDGVSVKGDLDLTSPGARLLIRNGLTLTGTVRLDNNSALGFAGDQTFDTGNVVFEGGSGFLSVEGNTTLTLGPAIVVRGKTGSIGQGVFFGGPGKLINQGLISADVAGATLFITGGQFDNAGTIAAVAAGSSVVITANPFTNTGTIQELNGGKVLINP